MLGLNDLDQKLEFLLKIYAYKGWIFGHCSPIGCASGESGSAICALSLQGKMGPVPCHQPDQSYH